MSTAMKSKLEIRIKLVFLAMDDCAVGDIWKSLEKFSIVSIYGEKEPPGVIKC